MLAMAAGLILAISLPIIGLVKVEFFPQEDVPFLIVEIEKAEGTISPTVLKLHEFFLISAFPSQFFKLFFGKRLVVSIGLRSGILPIFFSRFIRLNKDSKINMFFIARKNK